MLTVGALAGCADETSLLVEVTSPDLVVPDDVDALRFQVAGESGSMLDQTFSIQGAWPHSLTVLPKDSTSEAVTITVTALKAGTLVVERRVNAGFTPGLQRRIDVALTGSCVGVMCGAGETCSDGRCVPDLLDGGVDGGMDAGMDGGEIVDTGVRDTGVRDTGVDDTGVRDTGVPDTGLPDAGPPDSGYDAGPPLSCTDITRVEPTMGATESVMFDTSMTATRPRDLGVACGNTDPELRWAPQEVLEIVVPGSGPMQVEVDTAFPETDFSFNTVLQFRTSCETVPTSIFPPSCFNDQSADEVRARGAVTVEGGSTVYVIVTGFSEPPAETMQVDEGPVRVDVTVTPNQRPTVTDGALLLAADDVIVTATGSDPEGDPRGVVVNFYDAAGALIDIYGDGEATLEGDAFVIPFDPAPMEVDYTGQGIVLGTQVNLAGFVRGVMIPRVGFRVYDGGWAISDMLMVDVGEAEEVGFGEACGGEQICRAEMRCVDAICEGTPGATRACGMATAFPDIAVTADGPRDHRRGPRRLRPDRQLHLGHGLRRRRDHLHADHPGRHLRSPAHHGPARHGRHRHHRVRA